MSDIVCRELGLDCPPPDMTEWESLINRIISPSNSVTIGLVGKYVELHDAYLSVAEALRHSGIANHARVNIKWIAAESLEKGDAESSLAGLDGILVPGGFGERGLEGMMIAARYAREHGVPYFGICLGMQIAVIEFARHVIGWKDAHSTEVDFNTRHPVVSLMADQIGNLDRIGGTLRLGSYTCRLEEGSRSIALYGEKEIRERHRHRYEFNNEFLEDFKKAGMSFVGWNPKRGLAEIVELPAHPWFVGVQFHPEFRSRPDCAHPLFRGFVAASLENRENKR